MVRRVLAQLFDHAFDVLPFLLCASLVASHGTPTIITV